MTLRVAEQLDRAASHFRHRAGRLQDAADPVFHDLGKSPGPASHHRRAAGHGLQRRETERLALAGQHEEIALLEEMATVSSRPRKRTSAATSSSRASFSARSRSGPSPTMSSVAGMARRIREKTRTTSLTRLTSRKLEMWVISLCPGGTARRAAAIRGVYSSSFTKFGITEKALIAAEGADGLVSQIRGDRGDGVGPLDGKLGDGVEALLLTDQGDVGTVERGDHLEGMGRTEHLAGQPRRGGMGDRVMDAGPRASAEARPHAVSRPGPGV